MNILVFIPCWCDCRGAGSWVGRLGWGWVGGGAGWGGWALMGWVWLVLVVAALWRFLQFFGSFRCGCKVGRWWLGPSGAHVPFLFTYFQNLLRVALGPNCVDNHPDVVSFDQSEEGGLSVESVFRVRILFFKAFPETFLC